MTIGVICYLAVLSVYDIRTGKIPVVWLIAGSAAAAGVMGYQIYMGNYRTFFQQILPAWIPGGFFLIMGKTTGKVGYADGWVLMILGSILGFTVAMAAFLAGIFIAAAAAGILLVLKRVGKNDRLPFLPFLTAGVVFCLYR